MSDSLTEIIEFLGKDRELRLDMAEKVSAKLTRQAEQIEQLQKQAACTHHSRDTSKGRGLSQYSPFQHAWKCDKCHHIKQDEG